MLATGLQSTAHEQHKRPTAPQTEDSPMLTLAILSLVLIPVAIDLATRRHRQTIALSMQRPGQRQ